MTPVARSAMEGRVSSLEASVSALGSRVSAIESSLAAQSARQESNHQENRQSIHDIKGQQQAMLDQNTVTQQAVVRIQTKMDDVVGTDHGKPGKIDKLETAMKAGFDSLNATVANLTTIDARSEWPRDIVKAAVMALILAAVAHFSKW